MKRVSILSLVVVLISACAEKISFESMESPVFRAVEAKESGIEFLNSITPNDSLSFATFAAFNNGGGVAAGDLDNDGLVDLYFVSNEGENHLYRNLGELRFEKISDAPGVGGQASWQTGVTMADVNGDGWLDIYVSCVSGFRGTTGHNELYLNKGNFTFTESAKAFGLDQRSIGTQAAFFDFDHDGDLDCYLLNYAIHDANTYESISAKGRVDEKSGDKLLENRNGRFIDVTKKSGIIPAYNGFGLGVTVSDLNHDGWEDIYVSNDFHEDDFFYVNQKDGTFRESLRTYFAHVSRYSMGSDAADINNDGYIDLMTLDMMPPDEVVEKSTIGEDPNLTTYYKRSFGYYPQVSRNCLQLNLGGMRFVDIAGFAGVQATDWSWAVLMADFDLSGTKDMFVSNGVLHRPNDLDFLDFLYNEYKNQQDSGTSSTQLERPDYRDYEQLPAGQSRNFFFEGQGDGRFVEKSLSYGFDAEDVSTGATYADLDNDGDLELITNRLNNRSLIYENTAADLNQGSYLMVKLEGAGQNSFALGAKVIAYYNDQMQLQENVNVRGFQSSVPPILHFGFRPEQLELDSLVVQWSKGGITTLRGVRLNQFLQVSVTDSQKEANRDEVAEHSNKTFLEEQDNPIAYRHVEDNFIDFSRDVLIPFRMSLEGPALAVGDVNRDGLEDVFLGGATNQVAELWLQSPSGAFQKIQQKLFELDTAYEDVSAQFIDVDNDTDLDLYVVSGGNEFHHQDDRLYINNGGKGNFIRANYPKIKGNKSCLAAGDFDQDGDLDLFIGGRNEIGAYGQIPRSFLMVNDGLGAFSNQIQSHDPSLERIGMVTDAKWIDTDQDDDLDLVLVGEFMPITIFENRDGHLERCAPISSEPISGLYHSLASADFDGDGDIDLIAGNLGLNSKLLKSPNAGVRMYVDDFDNNRKLDQILSYQRGDRWFPAIVKKSELDKAMPQIFRRRFEKNIDFAGRSMDEIFSLEELERCTILEADQLASIYLENTGNNRFKTHPLPTEIQYSSVHALLIDDINDDEHLDVLVGGNFHGTDSYQGPYDASFGWVLLGNGRGSFEVKMPQESGFLIDGQQRTIERIRIGDQVHYLVASNDGPLRMFKKENNGSSVL